MSIFRTLDSMWQTARAVLNSFKNTSVWILSMVDFDWIAMPRQLVLWALESSSTCESVGTSCFDLACGVLSCF